MREDKAIDYVFRVLDIPWWYYGIAVLVGGYCLESLAMGTRTPSRLCLPTLG